MRRTMPIWYPSIQQLGQGLDMDRFADVVIHPTWETVALKIVHRAGRKGNDLCAPPRMLSGCRLLQLRVITLQVACCGGICLLALTHYVREITSARFQHVAIHEYEVVGRSCEWQHHVLAGDDPIGLAPKFLEHVDRGGLGEHVGCDHEYPRTIWSRLSV